KMPTFVWPFPVQSPTTGISPGNPNRPVASIPGSYTPLPFVSKYHRCVEGRYTPIFGRPSPVQSPTIGMSPGNPNVKGLAWSGIYHLAASTDATVEARGGTEPKMTFPTSENCSMNHMLPSEPKAIPTKSLKPTAKIETVPADVILPIAPYT